MKTTEAKTTLKDAYKLFQDGILALGQMERNGLRIDVEYIHEQKKKIAKRIKKLEGVIHDSDFYSEWKKSIGNKPANIYSSQQLEKYLYGHLKLHISKNTKSGKGSTDEATLEQLNIPELNTLLEIKKLQKQSNTYLDGFLREQVNGTIHSFYNLHLARSYRSSSNNPNFQNIPKRDESAMKMIRRAIYPKKGNQLLELDYSQLEVRIATCYHKDPTMLKYIETGHDMHKDIAMQIFKLKEYNPKIHKVLRGAAKNGFVFPEFYGDYYKNCATNLLEEWCKMPKTKWKEGMGIAMGGEHISDHLLRNGFTTKKKFEDHLQAIEDDFWNKRFNVYSKWKELWWKEYQKKGCFVSKTGFVYHGVFGKNDVINYPVQGSAFHVLLLAVIEGTKAFFEGSKFKTRIVGQIHDAIVLDVYPPELNRVINIMKCIMENDVRQLWPWIITPLEIEAEICPVNGSWAEKEPYKI